MHAPPPVSLNQELSFQHLHRAQSAANAKKKQQQKKGNTLEMAFYSDIKLR